MKDIILDKDHDAPIYDEDGAIDLDSDDSKLDQLIEQVTDKPAT